MVESFEVRIMRHKKTGLFLAISDDLKGLYVHARTEEDLLQRIPIAARDILEAETGEKVKVYPSSPAKTEFGDFHLVMMKFATERLKSDGGRL
jgi:predicted RNase H-like HicB family nuclease